MKNKKYEFNQQYATLKLREPINEGRVMFTIDDENIDQLFNKQFEADVDYIHDGPDVYYVTDQTDLEKFTDYVQSMGLDADNIHIHQYMKEEGTVTSGGEAYLPAMNMPSKKQNPFKESVQEYFIQVELRDARRALAIIDDSSYLSNHIKKRSSDVYTTVDVIAAEEFIDALKQNGINSKNNVEGYIDEDVFSGYTQDKNFRPGHTKDRGGFQYKDLWGMNEAYDESSIKTNSDELSRVEELLAQANRDRSYSVMTAYENRIAILRFVVFLEKKLGKQLPLLKFGRNFGEYLKKELGYAGPIKQNRTGAIANFKTIADILLNRTEPLSEENLEEAYVPENIKKFAKRKGVIDIVNQIARWSEKMEKRIVGGTAIGKDYNTLILDLTYQGGEIRINCETGEITVNDEPVDDYISFMSAVEENESLNENYARFRNETKTRSGSDQFHQAVKEVKKKVQEIGKLHNYLERMQQELSETQEGLKKKKYTELAIAKIKEEVKELNKKIRKLK
jgi:ribosome-associated protein YbcJ (S4-like RNA binding protein)